jgi:hypothetical protein
MIPFTDTRRIFLSPFRSAMQHPHPPCCTYERKRRFWSLLWDEMTSGALAVLASFVENDWHVHCVFFEAFRAATR